MTRSWTWLVTVVALVHLGCNNGGSGTPATPAPVNDAATAADIRAAVDQYVKAVNDADETLIRDLLFQPDQVSYVNPMLRLHSWEELQGFWQGFLKGVFTKRELKLSNVVIQSVGDVGWVVFDWEFNGMQVDGKPNTSHGWETQIYRHTDRGWRLAHGHYSGAVPPPTGAPGAP